MPGCIGCGLCQALAPKVFDVTNISHVRKGIEYQRYQQEIEEAVSSCPAKVIVYEEDEG